MKRFSCLFIRGFCLILFSVFMQAYSVTKPKIALVVKSMQNEFFVQMQKGAESFQAQHKNDFTLIFKGIRNETDLDGQIKIMNELLKEHIDVLLIAPVDSIKAIPTIMKFVKNHILVINLDNKLDERALQSFNVNIPFVGPSNFNGAKNLGLALAKQLKAGDSVGIIEGLSSSVNAKARSDGFRDAMKSNDILVVGTFSGFWEENGGHKAATELLEKNPNIKALLCGNDSMAIGAIQAVEDLKLKGKVYVVGYDNIPKVAPLIKSHSLFATVEQSPGLQATTAIELALDAIKSKKAQNDLPKIIHTKTSVIE